MCMRTHYFDVDFRGDLMWMCMVHDSGIRGEIAQEGILYIIIILRMRRSVYANLIAGFKLHKQHTV